MHHVDLVVCIAAAQRRGILDANEAKRQGKDADNIAPGFRISGLGPTDRGRHPGRPHGRLRGLRRVMADNAKKKFLYINRKAPYGTIYALESLEVVLIGAAFEQDVSLAFIDDGVFQLMEGQNTARHRHEELLQDLPGARRLRGAQALCRARVAGGARPHRGRPDADRLRGRERGLRRKALDPCSSTAPKWRASSATATWS